MLISSPEYGHLDRFFNELRTSKPAHEAFSIAYRKSLGAVDKDLQNWISLRNRPVHIISAAISPTPPIRPLRISDLDAGMLIGDLLVANNERRRAEETYRALLREYPNQPKLLMSLGVLALGSGSKTTALENWKKAIDSGVSDPGLCYRFALLAQEAGFPEDEVARALEKAISAKPDFSDARYRLAIIESNRGNYEAAVTQLKAMGTPSGSRAYSYWSALASCLSELGRTEEATSQATVRKSSVERRCGEQMANTL